MYNLNLVGMQMALKEQEIVGFAGKEGMRNLARQRLSIHEGAMSHVINYTRFFRVFTVTVDQMITFFLFCVLCNAYMFRRHTGTYCPHFSG